MEMKELKLGRSIEILVTREDYKLHLISKLEDVCEDHISVTLIEGNGRKFIFKDTDQIEFIYKDDNRLYKFRHLKGAITVLDNTYVHSFYGPVEGESFNRRNAFRVFLGEENTFSWTGNGYEEILHEYREKMEEANGERLTKDCPCIIKDLSENGAGIFTNERLELSDFVSFELLTSLGKIRCIGKVVRVSNERQGMYRTLYGVQFTEVSNVISKYIFAVQRLQLKKTRR
ncbi:MAG: PilZ domain-containing protein [bacterium]|nr:PilZ domain-containing protein [bacterium]